MRGGYFDHVVPGSGQSYFPPFVNGIAIIPLAAFGMVAGGQVIALLHAVMMGVTAAVLAKLLQKRRANFTALEGLATLAAVSILAATAPMPASMMGTTFADNSIALLLAAAFWQALRGFQPNRWRGGWMAILLSLAVSAKPVVLPFALALGICFYVILAWESGDIRRAAGEFVVFAVVSVAGCAVFAGIWAVLVYFDTGNPAFPLLNGIFRSPLLPPENMVDTRFLPGSWRQFFGYPVKMALGDANVSEIPFADVRYLAAAILAAMLILVGAIRLMVRREGGEKPGPRVWLLVTTLLLAFTMWRSSTSIQRYFAVEDILLSVLLVWLVLQFPRAAILPLLIAVVAAHLITVRYPDWGHVPRAMAAPMPLGTGSGVDDALVFLGEIPMGYAVASFGARTRFVMIQGQPGTMIPATDATSGFASRVRGLIDRDWTGGTWLLLRGDRNGPESYLRAYGLHATNDCHPMRTYAEDLQLCAVERGAAAIQ